MNVRFSAMDQEILSFVTSICVSVVFGMAENKSINVRTHINLRALIGGKYQFLQFWLLQSST